jgi:hypothetical protein
MIRLRHLALIFALVAIAPRIAAAADLIVVEVRGINLTPGQVVDGSKPLHLDDGQQLVLISANGTTIKLRGPFDGLPAGDAAGSQTDVSGALKALVTQKQARSDKIGAVRGAAPDPVPPEPWLLDVTHVGNRCIIGGRAVVLWRPGGGASTKLVITPYDRSWQVRSDWPGGVQRIALPPSVPLRDQTTYVVNLAGKETMITLLVIPAAVANDKMRVAWMAQEGCDTQAQALLSAAR